MMCGRLVILYTSRTLLVYSPSYFILFYFVLESYPSYFFLDDINQWGPTGRKRPSALLFLVGLAFFFSEDNGRTLAGTDTRTL
jgi:hypothetical protein